MTRPTQPIGTVILVAALMAAQVCLAQANRESPAAVEPSPVIKEAFQRASELLEAGKMQEAVELLDSTADEAGQTPEADQIRYASIQILGFSFQMEGKNKEALEQHAEVFLEKGSDEIKEAIYLQSGGIFKLTGNYERSRQTLDRYLEEFPPPTEQELEEFAERMRAAGEEAAAGTIQHPRIVARQIAERMLDDISFMGKEAPHFELTTLAGEQVTPGDYKGKVLLLDFWATSCPPCIAELPNLKALYEKHKDEGFEILGLSADEDEDKLAAFVAAEGMSWKQVYLGERLREFASLYKFHGMVPSMFLVDRQGVLRLRDVRGPRLEAEVVRLLKEGNATEPPAAQPAGP